MHAARNLSIDVNDGRRLSVYSNSTATRVRHNVSVDEIYERHIRPMEPKLIGAVWRVLGNEQEASDALQDALTRIWKHRRQLETHSNPSAWMTRIALNAAYDRLRLRKASTTEPLPAEIEGADPSASSIIEQRETERALLKEIGRLSPKQGQAILLRLVEDLPFKDVAEALGCSEATARVHVQRGRERLRDRLSNLHPTPKRSQS
jgi:RNA polymerase sigma-70 factor, ECF subfamily